MTGTMSAVKTHTGMALRLAGSWGLAHSPGSGEKPHPLSSRGRPGESCPQSIAEGLCGHRPRRPARTGIWVAGSGAWPTWF